MPEFLNVQSFLPHKIAHLFPDSSLRPSGRRRFIFLSGVVLALVLALWPVPGQAQDPLCDVALFDQMVERARLQGQRETATVENLVYKPDSILEYTCYPRFVDHIPPNIRYASAAFFADADGDDAPDYTVTNDFPSDVMVNMSKDPAETWMWSNFGHPFLGGRIPAGTPMVPAAANYVCDAMSAVWALAKCQHFAPEAQDEFYGLMTFAFTPSDIRRYPVACNAPYTLPIGDMPVMPAALVFTSAAVLATDCGQPIPTGQVITMPRDKNEPAGRPDTYNEKLCPNPTCTYVPTGLNTGNCAP